MARNVATLLTCAAFLFSAAPALHSAAKPAHRAAAKRSVAGAHVNKAELRQKLAAKATRRKTAASPQAATYAFTDVYDFPAGAGTGYDGPWYPPVEGPDGNLWGVSYATGANSAGEIFKITPAGALTDVYDFTGGNDGGFPISTLYVGQDGAMYGVATSGGATGAGVLYKITTAGGFSVVHTFGSTGTDGFPVSGIIQDAAGNFYGTMFNTGSTDTGEIYEVSADGSTFTDLHDCNADCAYPEGGLTQGSDGQFYGADQAGGNTQSGAIFSWSSANGFQLVYQCQADGDCIYPTTTLVEASPGAFLGHSEEGGVGGGDLFVISDGEYTQVADYFEDGLGVYPWLGSPFIAGDQNLYGVTAYGNDLAYGNIFQYNSTAVTDLYEFSGPDGTSPYGDVVQDSHGTLWGASITGGANGSGNIWTEVGSPAITPNISLTATSASGTTGQPIDLTFSALNAVSTTAMQCYAFTNNVSGGLWTGAVPSTGTAMVTPTSPGTYNFAFTCGGNQTAVASVTVVATGDQIKFTSVSHNFGSVAVGSSTVQGGVGVANYGVYVTNQGTTDFPFTLNLAGSPEFSQYNGCGSVIKAGKSCDIQFVFKPTAPGAVSAAWTLTQQGDFTFAPANGGTLKGTGIASGGTLTLTTGKHNFGSQTVGTSSATFGAVLTNATPNPLSLTITPSGATGQFKTVLNNCPAVLVAGKTCNLQYQFAPTVSGFSSALIGITSSVPVTAQGNTVSGLTLVGTGK